MKDLPVRPLSPEAQQRLMGQLYLLMAKQVKSYHKRHHMGENSSVPVELARELMASVEYTVELAGGLEAWDAETALKTGQGILEEKAGKARELLDLVYATAPAWQTECRWEALQCLRCYLAAFDSLHLAHRGPDDLFYPIPMAAPDGCRGINLASFYIQVLWLENQIMAAFSDEALEELWNRLPADALNQCEQVILNALGKAILSGEGLAFAEAEWSRLRKVLSPQTVSQASGQLCRQLDLSEAAAEYLRATATQSLPRIEAATRHNSLRTVFL